MKTKVFISLLLLVGTCMSILAQVVEPEQLEGIPSVGRDTIPITVSDSVPKNQIDSLQLDFAAIKNQIDSNGVDTLRPNSSNNQIDFSKVNVAKSGFDTPVDYTAKDSMVYDLSKQQIHLYGEANVKYEEISLTSDYIILDWKENIVTAEGLEDRFGEKTGIPRFKDGTQDLTAEKIRYNFDTQKGVVYDVATTQSGMYIRGSKSKFIRTEQDTLVDDVVFSEDAIFTSCNHTEPHYGVRSTKQKVVPNKVVIVGPSNIEIMGIPTPLWLPFGFFPLSEGKQTGLIFPNDYEYSDAWGFGLRGIGYYVPINDYMDLTVTGDIYLKGTWGLGTAFKFNKRYKYNGSVNLAYARRRSENSRGEVTFNPSFSIRTTLNQDRRAHPAIRIGGSVNIQTNGFQQVNRNDAQSVLENQLSSNLNFTHSFPNKPINLTLGLSHSQNTRTNKVDINFPNLTFTMKQVKPFKRKKGVGKEKWYENITIDYKGEARNRFVTTDSTLFSQQTLDNAQFGARHQSNLKSSFKVLKYFNLVPSVRYEEAWHFRTIEKTFVDTLTIQFNTLYNADSSDFDLLPDTLMFGTVDVDTTAGFNAFKPARQVTASLNLNTQIFGTLLFKKGFIRGIRHLIKPSIAFNYTPDYTLPSLGYYKTVQTDRREFEEEDFDQYSVFEGNIYGAPSASGQQASISYAINNIFEAKYFSKKDSTSKKLKLFDNIYIRGNYNFAKDSLQWSTVNMSGTTRFFDGITTLSLNATFDPYVLQKDENGRFTRRNTFNYKVNSGKYLRFDNASAQVRTNLTVRKIRDFLKRKRAEGKEEINDELPDRNAENEVGNTVADLERPEDILSLFENFKINHNLVLSLESIPDLFTEDINDFKDTLSISTNSLSMSGNIQLTKKWGVRVGNFGYDFVRKSTTYPDFGITRNLHCWELSFNWQPQRNTYSLTIQVSPGTPLDFLKIPYNRNNVDGGRFEGF